MTVRRLRLALLVLGVADLVAAVVVFFLKIARFASEYPGGVVYFAQRTGAESGSPEYEQIRSMVERMTSQSFAAEIVLAFSGILLCFLAWKCRRPEPNASP